jgi:acyl transferase domain-containing protein
MAGEDKLREYLKRVTVDLATARRQLAEADARASEPIAVVGLSCRFPEAGDPDAYWELLRSGRAAAVGDVPAGRFDHDPRAAGNDLYSPRQGAFLPDVAGFDADFFGFPPREALRMDPQQRLLMELAWEVMEDAGTPPASLAGSRTGVLLGFSDAFQYGQLEADLHGRRVYTDPYMGQGSLASVVAGRLAYHFDLRGPTFSLDTACSSSLVAVHLAVQALRNGECDYALAGGAYLALHPFLYIYSCATSLLSPTDRCHTFDAGADGYMMGEGGGMVMLTRLSDALRDGHRIRAVIRGSAVNQDGRSNGLTAPNRAAQVAVIRQALAAAGATPDQIDYLEAHGSGTRLGDEIEFGALNEVFGKRDGRRPLRVGAVKTNIGHTHTAAGIAGFLKAVLVLEHGTVPPNLNMVEPAEAVVESETVHPAAGLTPLVADDGGPLAGVSSFGWSGTNAHVVLAAAPGAPADADAPPAAAPPAQLLPVSAADDTALAAQLTRLAGAVGAAPLADVAYTLQAGRAAHATRRAVVATDATDAAGRLAVAAGQPGVRRAADRPRVAFLLPGVGDQYRGLGRALYRAEPVFAAAVDECVAVAEERCGLDLRPILHADPPAAPAAEPGFFGRAAATEPVDDPLEHAETSHPFLFTVQYALARLLAHRGVTPDLLVGYSLGEYVAACLAGVFTLADALWLVTERARLIEAAPAGRMLAAAADAGRVREVLAGTPAQVDVAALNGPQMTVLSGPPRDVADAAGALLAAGVAARELRSAHPFHSTLLQPAQDKLAALVASVPRQAPRTAVLSNATGVPLTDAQATDPRYWAEHLCLPVRFADAVRHCLAAGIDAYVELGAGQTLGALVRQNLSGDARPTVLGTLPAPWPAQDRPEENISLLETCGRLWELGAPLDFAALRHGTGGPTRLPTYPFQRTRYWPQPEEGDRPGAPVTAAEVAGPGLAYTATWRPDHTRLPADAAGPAGTLVVFADDRIGPELADRAAAAGARVVEVLPGDGFRRDGRRVTVDPTDPEHYRQVVGPLAAEGDGPVQVVHLWSLREPATAPVHATDAELETALRYAFDSPLLTVQALGAVPAARGVRLLTVTAGAAEIVGGDAVAPDRALAHGLARGVRAEHTDLAWRGVDLPADAPAGTAAGHLVEELRRGPWRYADPAAEPALVGWRGGRRWLKGWAELPLAEPGAAWDPDGVYLITGGTRGLGMVLARHLVGRGVRRLALVGRTDLRQGTGDRVARSRRDVAELEAAGAQVLLLTADAGEPDQLRAALAGAREHFGRLDGVVHCAGQPGGGMAARRTTTDARSVLAPKVRAMAPLAELVGPATPAEQRPRLLVLYSSVATVLGGLGESDYCAANSVLDAYGTALAAVADRTQVLTVAWGHWQHDDWPSELTGAALAERTAYRQRYGFTDAAGCELLDRLVAGVDGPVAGTVVALRQQLPQAVRDWTAINDVADLLDAAPRTAGTNRFPRPPLRVEYVPPRSALESTVAGVWGDYLGIDGVGIHDPFFDLGGNSLVGTAMVTAIERLLDRRIAPAVLFQHPTVAAFTAALDTPAGAGSARPAVGSARGARRRRAGSTRTIGTQQRGQDD